MKIPVYNQQGKEVGKTELPSGIFGVPMNRDLVHQAVVAQMAGSRQVIAHTKDRGEVRGGGRKPWRQKGTGRARHGSIRSPIWVGGGVAFGPTKARVFAKKINKKMKRKALFMALSSKVRDNELILLDDLKLEQPKTKEMVTVLDKILRVKSTSKKPALSKVEGSKVKKESVLVTLPKSDENVIRATRNIPYAGTIGADSLNIVDLLSYKYLVMPKEAIKVIENKYQKSNIKNQKYISKMQK